MGDKNEEQRELESELSSLDRQLFEFAQRAWKAGYEIWIAPAQDSGDYIYYQPGTSDVEFSLIKR